MFWDVDIKNGMVDYDDISHLPDRFIAVDHVDCLKEDMLQLRYPDDVLVDISWRPSMNERGAFHIVVIKNFDWEAPLLAMTALNVIEAKQCLRKAISSIA